MRLPDTVDVLNIQKLEQDAGVVAQDALHAAFAFGFVGSGIDFWSAIENYESSFDVSHCFDYFLIVRRRVIKNTNIGLAAATNKTVGCARGLPCGRSPRQAGKTARRPEQRSSFDNVVADAAGHGENRRVGGTNIAVKGQGVGVRFPPIALRTDDAEPLELAFLRGEGGGKTAARCSVEQGVISNELPRGPATQQAKIDDVTADTEAPLLQ